MGIIIKFLPGISSNNIEIMFLVKGLTKGKITLGQSVRVFIILNQGTAAKLNLQALTALG